MIGQLTQLTIDATCLALAYEQITWPQTQEDYSELRQDIVRFLRSMDLENVKIPESQDEFRVRGEAIRKEIVKRLSESRGKILDDTVALPFFFLSSCAYHVAALAPFGEPCDSEREIIEDCLEDIGLNRGLIDHLNEEIGWISIDRNDRGEPAVRHKDIIRSGASFFQRVLEEWGKLEEGVVDTGQLVKSMQAIVDDVREFREEYRAGAQHLESLIVEKNAEIVDLLAQVKGQLVRSGLSESQASEVVDEDPQGFRRRLMRWASSVEARDAAEKILWVALDFVPAGTGVKLGIGILRTARAALK